jgi:hypothetical protein
VVGQSLHGVAHNKCRQDEQRREGFSLSSAPPHKAPRQAVWMNKVVMAWRTVKAYKKNNGARSLDRAARRSFEKKLQ